MDSSFRVAIAVIVVLSSLALLAHLIVCGEIGRLAWLQWTVSTRGRSARALGWIRRYGLGVSVAAVFAAPTTDYVALGAALGAVVLAISIVVSRTWVGWLVGMTVHDAEHMANAKWAHAIGATERELFDLAYRAMRLRALRWLVAPAWAAGAVVTSGWAIARAARSSDGVPHAATFGWVIGALLVVVLLTEAFIRMSEVLDPRGVLAERLLAWEPAEGASTQWLDHLDAPWLATATSDSLRERVRRTFSVHSHAVLSPVRFHPAAFREAARTARQDLLRHLAVAVNHDSRDFEREWHEVLSVIARRSDPRGEISDDWAPPTPISSVQTLVAYTIAVIGFVGVLTRGASTLADVLSRWL